MSQLRIRSYFQLFLTLSRKTECADTLLSLIES